MGTPDVGADIEAICGRCGGETWHVVVAKVGQTLAKVVCKQCGAQHRYKAAAGGVRREHASGRRLAETGKGRRAVPEPVPEPPLVLDPSRPVKPYRPDGEFQQGDTVGHAKFGKGLVVRLLEPGKMEVRFPLGARVLARGRVGTERLAPPTRRLEDSSE